MIIVAAIALVVLVILAVIFVGRMNIFQSETGDQYCTTTLLGECANNVQDDDGNWICDELTQQKVGSCNKREGKTVACCKEIS